MLTIRFIHTQFRIVLSVYEYILLVHCTIELKSDFIFNIDMSSHFNQFLYLLISMVQKSLVVSAVIRVKKGLSYLYNSIDHFKHSITILVSFELPISSQSESSFDI